MQDLCRYSISGYNFHMTDHNRHGTRFNNPTPRDPLCLGQYTIVPAKMDFYESEAERYLMRGFSTAAQAFGQSLENKLNRLAMLIVKPHTVARRQVELCIDVLGANDFKVVRAQPTSLTVRAVRSLYRFQFNAITEGGKALSEKAHTRSPSLLLILNHTAPLGGRSASRRLAALKGPEPDMHPSLGSLRGAIGAINKVFDGVHCADESLDILRELAVIFEGSALLDLYRKIDLDRGAEDPGGLNTAIGEVYRDTPEHHFDLDDATSRVLQILRQASEAKQGAPVAQKLLAALEYAIETGSGLDWLSFAAGLAAIEVDPSDWDVLLVASKYVKYEIDGSSRLIGNFSSLNMADDVDKRSN